MTRLPRKLLSAVVFTGLATTGAVAAASPQRTFAVAGNTKKPGYDGTMATAGQDAPAPLPAVAWIGARFAAVADAASAAADPAFNVEVNGPVLSPSWRPVAGNTKSPCYDTDPDPACSGGMMFIAEIEDGGETTL